LKIAIVFLYHTFRFENWLSRKNKQVFVKYREIISGGEWDKYKIVEPAKGLDSVLEYILVDNPDDWRVRAAFSNRFLGPSSFH
jgi:hypothetical protein